MATMLESVKARCGIPASVTVYDSEYQSLIDDCMEEMKTAGVPASLLSSDNVNQGVLTCIVLYVKSMRGDDRSDTEKYMDMYRKKVFKLSLEPVSEVV
mgnify:CR=1 FL=1